MDKSTDIIAAISRFSFIRGQCTPCREGTTWMMNDELHSRRSRTRTGERHATQSHIPLNKTALKRNRSVTPPEVPSSDSLSRKRRRHFNDWLALKGILKKVEKSSASILLLKPVISRVVSITDPVQIIDCDPAQLQVLTRKFSTFVDTHPQGVVDPADFTPMDSGKLREIFR
ncbi:hypothetical protein HGRIS_004255 [Hohenbuehelia grisea]|uniref:Uncharacterized protein n=1 Tax=Hohenbuehelia grisea TaxID=104357 RepID=A0ABR3IPB5_9AGAR